MSRFLSIVLVSILILNQACEGKKDPSFEKGQIKINGTSLYVEVDGTGEPVIVIHGGPVMDHSYLQPHLRALAKQHQLIYYDQRVSGRSSSQVDTAQIKIEAFVEDIEGIRRHFELDKVHIFAHSWGGLLGMEYAIKNPIKTRSLLLINSLPPTSALWQKEQLENAKNFTPTDSVKRQQIIQSNLFKENKPRAIDKLLRLSFKSQFRDSNFVDSLDLFIPDDYMKRSQLFGNLAPYLANYDLTEELQQLRVPTLIVYGSGESASEISGPALDSLIENSDFRIIENSGHFPFIEQKQQFNNIVIEFLNSH